MWKVEAWFNNQELKKVFEKKKDALEYANSLKDAAKLLQISDFKCILSSTKEAEKAETKDIGSNGGIIS